MTLVGKIFTMLILVMSILFLGFSLVVFATHKNWRDEAMRPANEVTPDKPLGTKYQLEEALARNIQLREVRDQAYDKLDAERAARVHVVANLHTKLEAVRAQLEAREKEYADLQSAHRIAAATLETTQAAMDKLVVEVNGLRDDIRDAQAARDTTFDEIVVTTDKYNASQGELSKLEETQSLLAVKVSKYKKVMDVHGLKLGDDKTGVPDRDGYVTAVGSTNRVEISLGSDDGIRKGHFLDVYRKGTYLGRIQVQDTQPDRAVGLILKEFHNGVIRKGDYVATNI